MPVRTPGTWPPVRGTTRPADYVADDVGTGEPGTPEFVPGVDRDRVACRGSVEYSPAWSNYSLHKVDFLLAENTEVVGANFSLSRLRISGAGALTLRDCNLVGARWRALL